jgi:chromate transporter
MREPSDSASRAAAGVAEKRRRLGELGVLFAKLGLIGFGGPAAHIAMMEDEVVARRGWLERARFLDLVGATNLIPGPNSTEMAIHIGHLRAGWPGLAVAGLAFILPAVTVTGAFAWAYVRFGTLPEVEPFLYGIKPAVIAVILAAVWRLGRTAVKGWELLLLGVASAGAVLLGLNEIAALLAGGVLGMLWLAGRSRALPALVPVSALDATSLWTAIARPGCAAAAGAPLAAAFGGTGPALLSLGLFFLKVGAVLYGSGYVLVAFLEGGLVRDYGWLTEPELLDAVALGQITPGPVLSTATFIGYILAGAPGAAVATVAIFLPSFLFVALLARVLPHLRRSRWSAAFLDSVNVSALGLMAAVTLQLSASTLVSWPAWAIAAAAAAAALGFRLNAAWLVLGGAIVGRVLWAWA